MKYDDETIRFILANHWLKKSSSQIAKLVRGKFKTRMSFREINTITSTWTLRHHGEPITRDKMGLDKIEPIKQCSIHAS